MNSCYLKNVAELFNIEGSVLSAAPLGNGHINDTYLVVTDSGRYILQRINTHVFRSPDQLMHNIKAVTDFTHSRMQVITTSEGGLCTVTRFEELLGDGSQFGVSFQYFCSHGLHLKAVADGKLRY